MTGDPRRVEYMPVSELRSDPRNPKSHASSEVKASISRFGFVEPIALDGRTGYIISGHGRTGVLTQMEKDGGSAPSGVKVDDQGRWLVPVVVGWESRTDADAAGAIIALNRTSELGGWDDEGLLDLLEELAEDDGGFDGIGFGDKDVEDLQKLLAEQPDLDDLADQWDGLSGLSVDDEEDDDSSDSEAKITLRGQEAIEAWQQHRAQYSSDDQAILAALAGA